MGSDLVTGGFELLRNVIIAFMYRILIEHLCVTFLLQVNKKIVNCNKFIKLRQLTNVLIYSCISTINLI